VAQWIAHQTSDLGVGGSSPPRGFVYFFAFVSKRKNAFAGN
jgi:hypothetical protein